MTGAGESRGREAVDELEGQRDRRSRMKKKVRVSFRWKKVEASKSQREITRLKCSTAQPKHWGFFFIYLNRYRVPVSVPGPHFLDPAPEPVATGSGILEPVPEPV